MWLQAWHQICSNFNFALYDLRYIPQFRGFGSSGRAASSDELRLSKVFGGEVNAKVGNPSGFAKTPLTPKLGLYGDDRSQFSQFRSGRGLCELLYDLSTGP